MKRATGAADATVAFFSSPRFAFFIACFSFFIFASDARWPE
jgi:hypothetical protein